MDDTNKKATKELVDMIHYVAEESTKDAPYDRTRKGRIVEVHRNISTNEIIGYDVKIEDKEYYIKKEQGKNITVGVNDIVYVNFPCNNVNNIYLSHIDGEENIYSENEVKTNGVWIDGKTIYRKVIQVEASGGSTTPMGVDSSNIVYMHIELWNISNQKLNIPYYINSATYGIANTNGTNFNYQALGDPFTNGVITVIIEYTKTT